MGRLTEHLDSLKIEDGSPDKAARRAELNGLITHLTTSEIQELRLQLNAVVIANDICTKFPPELVQSIAKHLELEELIRTRHVCQSWNRHFGSPELSVEFIKWHFPFIWERDFRDFMNKLPMDNLKLSPHRVLLDEAEKRIRRKRGMYYSTSIYEALPRSQSPPEQRTIGRINNDLELRYCNGRLAYSTDRRRGLTVKDLRLQTTTIYVDENRRYLADWLLSDTLLLVAVDNRNTLLGWRLDKHKHKKSSTLRFPSSIQTVSALYERVGVVTTTHEVLIWKYGGPVQQINLGDLGRLKDGLSDDSHLDYGRVFFHPLKADVSFVIFLILGDGSGGGERLGRIVVLECSQQEVNSIYQFDLLVSPQLRQYREKFPRFLCLQDGNIGIYNLDRYSIIKDPGLEGHYNPELDNGAFPLIIFNVLKSTFEYQTYQLPEWVQDLRNRDVLANHQICFWRDQILVPVYNIEANTDASNRPAAVANSLLATFDKNSSRDNIRWYKQSELVHSQLSQILGDTQDSQDTIRQFVHGDDDFVVLAGQRGFVVWSFDKAVTLPVSSI